MLSDFRQFQDRTPIITDKLLIDFVNGIHVNQAVIEYRRNRGFFGMLIDNLSGKADKQKLLVDLNLTTGQEALRQIVTILTHEQATTNVALAITQKSLLETREAVNRHTQTLNLQQVSIKNLEQYLTGLIQDCQKQFEHHEQRIQKIELAIAAQRDFDRIIGAWESERTYYGLPWGIQVILLTQEIYNSAVAFFEYRTGDQHFRGILTDKILSQYREYLPKRFISLPELLQATIQATALEDYDLVSDLIYLESWPSPQSKFPPLLSSFSAIYDLNKTSPDPSFEAVKAAIQDQISTPIPHTFYSREFIYQIVHETATYTHTNLNWSLT